MGFWGGGGGGSSSPPPYPVEKIKKMMDEYIRDTKADIKPLIRDIAKLGDKVTKQVDNLVAKGEKQLSQEEKELLSRLKQHEQKLTKFQETEDAALLEDLGEINADFQRGMNLVDAKDKAAFQKELQGFQAKANKLTANFDKRATNVISKGDAESKKILKRGDRESKNILNQYEQEGLSLGDRYLEAVDTAQTSFDAEWEKSLDLSPERLAIFSQAADFLSKSAQQTRLDMIAAADPRAAELSAIADENAAAMMSGRISADTQANLARTSAMRALQGGFGAGSEMGRGLTARDLGLTAMDLQQQGFQNYEAQRRLNFDTRVAGLQADAGALLTNDMTARQRQAMTNYEVGLRTAESDRDQRQGVFNTALAGNLARVDTRVGRDMGRVDNRVTRQLGVAGEVFAGGMETNRVGYASQLANRDARTARQANNLTNVWDRNFQTRTGIYNTNIATGRSIYGTNVNAAGNIFNTQAGAIQNATAARIGVRGDVYGMDARTRLAGFEALTRARTNAAATNTDAIQKDWAAENARYSANQTGNNALWGNLLQGGLSIAGAAIGTAISPGIGTMVGGSLGGMAGGAINEGTGLSGGSGSGGGLSSSMGIFTSALGGRGQAGTTYNSFAAAQNAAPYTNIFSFNNGMGYTPVAMSA